MARCFRLRERAAPATGRAGHARGPEGVLPSRAARRRPSLAAPRPAPRVRRAKRNAPPGEENVYEHLLFAVKQELIVLATIVG